MTTGSLLTLQAVADELGVHYMTAYRYVRLGILPAYKDGSVWRIQAADLALFANREKRGVEADAGQTRRNVDWTERLMTRLVAGDQRGAESVVAAAMTSGMHPEHIYLNVLSPALRQLGERWADGELTVAQEHQGFAVASRIVGQLGVRFTKPGRSRGVVVLGAVAEDFHSLPVTMLADVLRGEGYEVLDLGGNVPAEAFAEVALGQTRMIAVGLSASAPNPEPQLRLAIKALRKKVPGVFVLVGGGAIPDSNTAIELGADGWAADAREAVTELQRLVDSRAGS